MPTAPSSLRPPSLLAVWGFWLAVISGAMAILAGPAHKIGLLPLATALKALEVGTYIGIAAGILCVAGLIQTSVGPWKGIQGRNRALIGIVICVFVVGFVLSLAEAARTTPKIHDISTARYPGGDAANLVAAREIYPDVQSIMVDAGPTEAFSRVERTAQALRWRVTERDVPTATTPGRLVAIDRSAWFGLEADVIVVVSPDGDGTRLDLRSTSRFGAKDGIESDMGANANRILRFGAIFADITDDANHGR